MFPNGNINMERDREATEKRLLDTIGQMIAENGFEKIGINAVSAQSGVSQMRHRYFLRLRKCFVNISNNYERTRY